MASICLQHCEGPKSLPSPPVTSPFLLFPCLPLSPFPFPLEVAFLNPARGSGKRCKLPQWGLAILVHFEGEGTLLVVFKMHGCKQQKTAFLYIFMKKFSKS